MLKFRPADTIALFSFRAPIILLHDEGRSVAEIANIMDTSKVAVYKWIARYREGGLPTLESRKSTGRPRQISGEISSRILALSPADATDGNCACRTGQPRR